MPRIPTPLINFAVLEDLGMVDRLTTLTTSGIVSGPFAIYPSPFGIGGPFTLIHLPSQAKIIDLQMQSACRDAAEKFAALDLNWWTCNPAEVIGPDLQEMRNIHERLKPNPWIASSWGTEDR
jgi:hypothetical protein